MALDVARLRDDLGAFSQVAGRPLTPWQVRALGLDTRVTCIVAPRQSGKSYSLSMLAVWWAFRLAGQHVLIVSSGEEAAKRLLAAVRDVATSSPVLRHSVVDEALGKIELDNGSVIRSVPASARQIRGWTTDLLIVDEAAFVEDALIESAAFPTTAARPDARIVMASTPWAPSGSFYRNALAGEGRDGEFVRTHRWALKDAKWISPSVVAHARESMPEARFRAEFGGEFVGATDAMFSPELLARASADYRTLSLAELRPSARVALGCDWGVVHDRSACVGIGRLPVGAWNPDLDHPVFGVVVAHVWEAGAELAGVVDEIVRSPAHVALYSFETNGVGAGPGQDLVRRMRERQARLNESLGDRRFTVEVNAVATTANVKAESLSRLRTMLERGTLVLPKDERLMRELGGLRVELRPSGSVGIEADNIARHDDVADALWIALGPLSHGRFAVPDLVHRCGPEADVRAWNGADLVESGEGIRIPRVPPLQSLIGDGVTDAPRPPKPGESARDDLLTKARRGIALALKGEDR